MLPLKDLTRRVAEFDMYLKNLAEIFELDIFERNE